MKVNLLPKEYSPTYIRTVLRGFVVLNLVVFSGLALLYTNKLLEQYQKTREIVAIEENISLIEAKVAQTNASIEEIDNYERMIDPSTKQVKAKLSVEDYEYSNFLYSIGSLTPENIKIGGIAYPDNYEITIVGQGEDYADVLEFYNRLQNAGLFSTLNIQHTEIIPLIEDGNKALKKAVNFTFGGTKMEVEEVEN